MRADWLPQSLRRLGSSGQEDTHTITHVDMTHTSCLVSEFRYCKQELHCHVIDDCAYPSHALCGEATLGPAFQTPEYSE